MQAFEAIDLLELVTVTGGEDTGTFGPGAGPNRIDAEGNLSVKTPVGIDVSGSGKYQQSQSDYAYCVSHSPADKISQCLPLANGGQSR